MRYIRVIHPKHFDAEGGRINELAFKNSKDGSGISCFELGCAIAISGSACRHIETFYPAPISGNPIVYWVIPDDAVFANCQWDPETSLSGDKCHRNLKGIGSSASQRFFRKQPLSAFTVCDGQIPRQLQASDLAARP